jgi:hypothetical protein
MMKRTKVRGESELVILGWGGVEWKARSTVGGDRFIHSTNRNFKAGALVKQHNCLYVYQTKILFSFSSLHQ